MKAGEKFTMEGKVYILRKIQNDIKTLEPNKQYLVEVGELKTTKPSEKFPEGCAYITLTDIKTGEVANYWFSGGLAGKFKMLNIGKGSRISLTPLGIVPHPTAPGQTLNDYDIMELVEEKAST